MAKMRSSAVAVEIPIPEYDPIAMDSMSQEQKVSARAMTALGAHTKILVLFDCTIESYGSERPREVLYRSVDSLMRSRPWATNRDKAFPYPFREATEKMRALEGPWSGDDDPFPREWTRGVAGDKVLTNVRQVKEYPPELRFILFTPEFGSVNSFAASSWQQTEMIEQVTRKVLSFADGVSTVWYGHSMGAIVAYEVLKRFDQRYRSPNLPVALIVSGCPAPHLFSDFYRPQEKHDFLLKLRIPNDFDILTQEKRDILLKEFQVRLDNRQDALQDVTSQAGNTSEPTDVRSEAEYRKAIVTDLKVLMSYAFEHGEAKAVSVPVIAMAHDEDNLVEPQMVQAWEAYAPGPDSFEFLALEDVADGEVLAEQGHGYAMRPDLAAILPDIGPTDGEIPAKTDCVIVGAGIAGVTTARAMAEAGRDLLVFDKYDAIGGIWTYYANIFSRVNTSEVGYRMVNQQGPGSRPNEDAGRLRKRELHNTYHSVPRGGEGDPSPKFRLKTGETGKIHAKSVCFHTNRRIGKRRDVDWPGKEKFRGECVYGYANEVTPLKFWGKTVMVIGAGAFAYENLRTALEHGAKHVTMLGRRSGTTCPKWIDVIAFLRPCDQYYNTDRNGNVISFDAWKQCYDAGLPQPECWAEGLLKPHNHTVSVSDLAFIAGYHGLATLKVGEIAAYRPDGHGVVLKDGSKVDCDIIIKAWLCRVIL
eukprot:s7215_g2.t2